MSVEVLCNAYELHTPKTMPLDGRKNRAKLRRDDWIREGGSLGVSRLGNLITDSWTHFRCDVIEVNMCCYTTSHE